MKHSLRILFSLLLVAALVLGMASCGSATVQPDDNITADDGSNISSGGTDGTDGGDDVTDGSDSSFGSEYPIITVADALEYAAEYTDAASTEVYYILVTIDEIENISNGTMTVSDATGSIYIYRCSGVSGLNLGYTAIICGTLRNYKGLLEIHSGTVVNYRSPSVTDPTPGDTVISGEIDFPEPGEEITSDPYENVDKDVFYANYRPAVSYEDAYYRTLHNLMSGTIGDQDQEPTVSEYRPMQDGLYVRNTAYLYSDDGNTYYVVDAYGEITMEIYRGGAYIMLEEVAAYVFAFGEPPANQISGKDKDPSYDPWGEYLRLNHTKFTGNTSKYPYEPMLPNISGCGGDLVYYEMDVGTTGTDCDSGYICRVYNDGNSITRGAARIVYTRYDLDGDGVIEMDETFLFYTYNHYNDFQEYLNYDGGWGEMFGNITGGGVLSSKEYYSPTPYVEVVGMSFVLSADTPAEAAVTAVFIPVTKEGLMSA